MSSVSEHTCNTSFCHECEQEAIADLRAALAESQAREAALVAPSRKVCHFECPRCWLEQRLAELEGERDLAARWSDRAIELDQKVVAAEALIGQLRAAGDALAEYVEYDQNAPADAQNPACKALAAWRAVP